MKPTRRTISLAALMTLLAGSGVLHLVKPEPYVQIVPSVLPKPELLVFLSGLAEILAAALLGVRRTRNLGAWFTAALLIAVFPANVFMLIDSTRGTPRWWGSLIRLPLQPVLVLWALSFRSKKGG